MRFNIFQRMGNFHQLMINQSDEEFEKILANPILDIAARFWDEERYNAFKICYRSMRQIDDLVDHRKAEKNELSSDEISHYTDQVRNWSRSVTEGQHSPELKETIEVFKIPHWPWERLAKAMEYDLRHNGFSTFDVFLRYCEGAAIAPASVFMHLCGVKKPKEGYVPATFDIHSAAKGLAVFSYLVHILRDFQKDQLRNLNYFADDVLRDCELDARQLREIVGRGEMDWRIIHLFAEYKSIASRFQQEAQQTLARILPRMGGQYQLSLQIIYGLYSHLYEKIDPKNRAFSETDVNLSPEEVKGRIALTIKTFKPL